MSLISPDLPTSMPQARDWVAGGGEMGELIRSTDWSKTSLGSMESWPQSLRSAVSILLPSRAQIAMFWGPDLITLYNDAYSPVLGKKHPRSLGLPIREVWSELWDAGLKELFEGVLRTGEAFWANDWPFYMERYGFPEETFFDISYDPIRDETGKVGGLFCIVSETTARVVSERQLKTLRDLSLSAAAEAKSVEEACRAVGEILSSNRHDVPFALVYLLDRDGKNARLAGTSGLDAGTDVAPMIVEVATSGEETSCWPFNTVVQSNSAVEITDVIARCGNLPSGVWPESPHTAIVSPIKASGQGRTAGFFVAGVSPRRPLDHQYRAFFDLLTTQISTKVSNARAYEEERRRAEALAELDRAKTTFFSNVSHEFRTPLTLMLGPVADLLREMDGSLPASQRERLEIAHRNALRLQKLVNTLLDFSRIEAGRVQCSYEPTDLAALTADLASNFRAACEKAGLEFVVNCDPLSEPVYVDPDMWEKIVLNLISNAFKFTLAGRIEVALSQLEDCIQLTVSDTGVGIPREELPKLFERFHRVEVSRGRTQEGSGIGLALVRELIKLHGGSVSVQSTVGQGSVFTVFVPRGKNHLPADRINSKHAKASTRLGAATFVSEAMRWLPGFIENASEIDAPQLTEKGFQPKRQHSPVSGKRFRVLLADDNADMRAYLRRLLRGQYEVNAVSDGEEAWRAIEEEVPDLILSDVMMPRVDGFELLRRVRASAHTREVPVILVSARAGEEARIEGLEASADDYLVKPFSANELLATVAGHINMLEVRRQSREALRASEEGYRQLLSFLPVAVYTCTSPAGEITFFNERAVELWGRKPEPGDIDRRFCGSFRLWRPDGTLLPHDQTPMALAVQQGVAFRNEEVVIERPDGTRINVLVNIDPLRDDNGNLVGAINAFHDTTELKLTQQALRASEEQYRQIFEQSIDGVFIATKDGHYMDVSPSGWAMFGMTREEILESSFNDLLAPEEINRIPAEIGKFVDGKVHRSEWRFRRKDGSEFVGEVSGRELPDGRLQGILRDITERKKAESALRESERELKEADRRKDEFLATLAHELRNPLAPICNGLQLIRLSENNHETLNEATTIIERQVHQMVRLVDDLLDVARISSNKLELRKEPVTLDKIVNIALETSRPLIENATHNLQILLPDEPVILDADPVRLAQAFSNLLNNAAKYSQRGSRIKLMAQLENDRLVVKVRDTGIGIDTDKLPQIFEMFVQVDPARERAQGGLGIGLTLVKRLVEMHGGSIKAQSEGPGKGSEFIIQLPVSTAKPAEERAPEEISQPKKEPAKCRILVVDDNVDSAESMALMLQLSGHEVAMAHDGLEAVEMAERFRPDVAFLDLGMPKLNGYDAALSIRRQPWGQSIVLVALTGWGQEEDKRRTREAGFNAHVVKPIDFLHLEQLVAEVANGKRVR